MHWKLWKQRGRQKILLRNSLERQETVRRRIICCRLYRLCYSFLKSLSICTAALPWVVCPPSLDCSWSSSWTRQGQEGVKAWERQQRHLIFLYYAYKEKTVEINGTDTVLEQHWRCVWHIGCRMNDRKQRRRCGKKHARCWNEQHQPSLHCMSAVVEPSPDLQIRWVRQHYHQTNKTQMISITNLAQFLSIMLGKHSSKGIESCVDRLHSTTFIAVCNFSSDPLFRVHPCRGNLGWWWQLSVAMSRRLQMLLDDSL